MISTSRKLYINEASNSRHRCAAAKGISQKLVFVTIDAITHDNDTGVLNVTTKAWKVPE